MTNYLQCKNCGFKKDWDAYDGSDDEDQECPECPKCESDIWIYHGQVLNKKKQNLIQNNSRFSPYLSNAEEHPDSQRKQK